MNQEMLNNRLNAIRAEISALQQEAVKIEKALASYDSHPTMHKQDFTKWHIKTFYGYFKGRKDVYSKRGNRPDLKTGKVGYYPIY